MMTMAAMTLVCVGAARTLRDIQDDDGIGAGGGEEDFLVDPMDGVLPPRILESIEYIAYYLVTTSCK